MPDYSWIPFFEELANKILEFDEYINFTEMINCYNAIEKVINGINDKYLTNTEDK